MLISSDKPASSSLANEIEKLVPRLGTRTHASQHAARHRRRTRLLHAAHDHAQVARFHDDGDALRLQHLRDGQGDLFREPLLDL